jgi:hypothetical protein
VGRAALAAAPPRLDNRFTQSEDYLGAIIDAAGDWDGLLRELDQAGREMFHVIRALDEETAAVPVPAHMVHAGEVQVDGEWVYAEILGDFHTIGHADQLAGLRS